MASSNFWVPSLFEWTNIIDVHIFTMFYNQPMLWSLVQMQQSVILFTYVMVTSRATKKTRVFTELCKGLYDQISSDFQLLFLITKNSRLRFSQMSLIPDPNPPWHSPPQSNCLLSPTLSSHHFSISILHTSLLRVVAIPIHFVSTVSLSKLSSDWPSRYHYHRIRTKRCSW